MSLNITPHIPQVVVNASVPSTEALVRSNAIKEVVPAPVKVEANVPQKSRDQEARSPITEDVTYERVSPQNNKVIPEDPQNGEGREQGQSQEQEPQDNAGSDDSSDIITAANPENSDEASQNDESKKVDEQERQQELREIQQLSARDMEVRNHELAHAAVGGSYAGAPSYEYQTGPDGKKYAVGGEVSIDVSKGATPQETIEKMQTVKAAALAPAEPSSQDRKVAAEASQNIAEARIELVRESEQKRQAVAESVQNSFNDSDSDNTGQGDAVPSQTASSETAQLQKASSVIAQRYNTSYVEETDPSSQFTAVA
ncbi:putative metalloprotease CJM1_0395 family protein [Psychrosphaera sp.]|nr:putative metalloprotease CJM1_0395 family protein [Psychrosphaera sp.]